MYFFRAPVETFAVHLAYDTEDWKNERHCY